MKREDLRDIKLNCWKDIVVRAEIEEDPNDIHIAISYHDHGDDFLFIQTKDGKRVEYGFYCNREDETDYEDLKPVGDPKNRFVRNPSMFCKDMDEHATVSNELYFDLDRVLYEKSNSYFGKKLRRYYSKNSARLGFEDILSAFEKAFETGSFYDYSDKKEIVMEFLERNEIDTPENLELLKNAHMSSKVNGIDGIAGKRLYDYDYLVGDGINFVLIDDNEVDVKDLAWSEDDTDEWGYSTKYLPLDQFDEKAVDAFQKDILEGIESAIGSLSEIKSKINEYNIFDLNELREVFIGSGCHVFRRLKTLANREGDF